MNLKAVGKSILTWDNKSPNTGVCRYFILILRCRPSNQKYSYYPETDIILFLLDVEHLKTKEGFFTLYVEYYNIKLLKEAFLMDSKGNVFWGSFVVYNSKGIIIEKGELYSHNGTFPEKGIMRVASRHSKNVLVKFFPGIRCNKAE